MLNSLVTVVDALKAKMYLKNFGEFFQNQVAHAGAILLSRTAECPANRLEEVVGILRELNPHARIVTTPWKELTGTQLLQTMEGSRDLVQEVLDEIAREPHHEHHHHHHDHDHDHAHEHHHDHDHDEHHHDHGPDCTCGCHTTITTTSTIITTIMTTAAAAMTTTMTRTRCSPPGARKPRTGIPRTS